MSVTPVTIALTTTFTPASRCLAPYLTQLSSPGYEIWFAEPMPVPSTTASVCYPSAWLENYTQQGTTSIAPLVSPLVCPSGWKSVWGQLNGYMACCPLAYGLAPPSTTVDSNRPAYGGTCYSDVTSGQVVTVTAYDSASITATAEWTASVTNAQVYAHPIDGFQDKFMAPSTSSLILLNNATATTSPPSSTFSASTTTTSSGTPLPASHDLQAGAVIGAIIGSVVFVATLAFLIPWCLVQRGRRAYRTMSTETVASRGEKHELPSRSATIDKVKQMQFSELEVPEGMGTELHGDYRAELSGDHGHAVELPIPDVPDVERSSSRGWE